VDSYGVFEFLLSVVLGVLSFLLELVQRSYLFPAGVFNGASLVYINSGPRDETVRWGVLSQRLTERAISRAAGSRLRMTKDWMTRW